jgi:hypothetical protein
MKLLKKLTYPNIDRAIDLCLLTFISLGLKSLIPWLSFFEIAAVVNSFGFFFLGEIRAKFQTYPYEAEQTVEAEIVYPYLF